MTRFEQNLRIPGPTALPPSVREAGGRQMVNHRGDEFKALLHRVDEGMRPFFGTTSEVILLTCAGTGGLEAAIVNTLSPGDPVLAVTMGAFGDRFASIAETYGATVTRLAGRVGPGRRRRRGPRGRGRDPGPQGRAPDPQRDLDGRDQRPRAARGRGPGRRAGRAGARGRDLRARGRAVRDGRLGPGPRRDRLAEGLDGGAGHGDGGPRAPRLGRRRDRADAALLPRPAPPPRRRRRRRDPVDTRGRGAVPGGRGPAADAGRGRRRVRAPRGVRRRWPEPGSARSASSSSPTTRSPRRRSPPPGSPTGWTGRRSTARSSGAGSSSRAARASSRAGSSGSATSGRSTTDDVLAALGTLEAALVELGRDVTPGVAVTAAQQALLAPARTPAQTPVGIA